MTGSARILALLLAATLSACNADRLEPREAAGIKTIQLVTPAEPKRYDINVFAAPGMGMRIGAYDAVLANDIMRTPDPDDIDAKFTKALTEKAGLNLSAELADALEESLTAAGYQITRDKGTASDAILTATPLFAGYVDQPLRPYTPLLIVEIMLRSRESGTTLFRQRYTYSRLPYLADDVNFAPDGRYASADEAVLLSNLRLAAEGLRVGISWISGHLATQMGEETR